MWGATAVIPEGHAAAGVVAASGLCHPRADGFGRSCEDEGGGRILATVDGSCLEMKKRSLLDLVLEAKAAWARRNE